MELSKAVSLFAVTRGYKKVLDAFTDIYNARGKGVCVCVWGGGGGGGE